jgi:hypothetical protein
MLLAGGIAADPSVLQAEAPKAAISADIGYPTVAAAWAAQRARSEIVPSKEWAVFLDSKSGALWRFTRPGNPFHPSVVMLKNCESRVLCEAGKNACDQLVAQERKLEERSGPFCRPLRELDARSSVSTSPTDHPPVKADAVVTFNGPAKRCEVTASGRLARSMPCPEVVSYLTQTLKLPPGAYVDEATIPDVDLPEYDRVLARLRDAGYRPTPGVHVGFLTEPRR